MSKLFIGLVFISISSCTYVGHVYSPTIAYTSVEAKTLPMVVCKDPSVLHLKDYKNPVTPDVDSLPEGDVMAEVNMLLDYIQVLRSDITKMVKDYDCSIL